MLCNIYCVLVLCVFRLSSADLTEVFIEQGAVKGKFSSDGTFAEFTGIPYATANSTNRFRAPLPPPTWDGVFDATNESVICAQNVNNTVIGQEDCLKINIYVPSKGKRPLSVMFYIHGGGYQNGAGGKELQAPEFLMHQEVILATINYRLGPFGFICLGIKDAPGNAGLKDQLAALRWVRRNIAAFGGDPDEITIFGESVGASSVSLFLANNNADGLYKRAILQSGASIASWAVNADPISTASLLAKSLGFDTKDPIKLYKILSEASYEDLVRKDCRNDILQVEQNLFHLPCVEKRYRNEESFLTDLPYNILRKRSLNVPVIYGSNSNELLYFINTFNDDDMRLFSDKYFIPNDLIFSTKEEKETVRSKLKKMYLGDDKMFNMNSKEKFIKYLSHTYFNMPSLLEFDLLKRNTRKPMFYYLFNYAGGRNGIKLQEGHELQPGAAHADDLFYIFNGTAWPHPGTSKDQTMVKWMSKMWTNLAKFGDPTPDFDTELPVKWTPYNPASTTNYLYIEDEMKMGPMPFKEEYDLWKTVYDKYRRT